MSSLPINRGNVTAAEECNYNEKHLLQQLRNYIIYIIVYIFFLIKRQIIVCSPKGCKEVRSPNVIQPQLPDLGNVNVFSKINAGELRKQETIQSEVYLLLL